MTLGADMANGMIAAPEALYAAGVLSL